LSKHFNTFLVICETIFFAVKNKVNSIHYHNNCISYSIFKHNA
jgi:hypothetical protein